MSKYDDQSANNDKRSSAEPRRYFIKRSVGVLAASIFFSRAISATSLTDIKVKKMGKTERLHLEQLARGEEAKAVVMKYGEYLREGNVLKIVALYHVDAEIIPHGLPSLKGLENIEAFYWDTFKQIRIAGALQVVNTFADGNVVCVRCEEPATVETLETGEIKASYFRELFVLRRLVGRWKIQFYFFSENPAQANA